MTTNPVELYSELQRRHYDDQAGTRENAEALVAPHYADARVRAGCQAQWAVNEHLRRRPDISAPVDAGMRILDFGCGVGRVMEAMVELGFENVDGVDISAAMLDHALLSPTLGNSKLWVTDGHGIGDAPEGHYDLAYSFICLNHISMRQTRIDIVRALGRALKPGGTVVLEFLYYPSIHASQIPLPHVPWNQNRPSPGTNSEADVWVTPDMLGEVADDMRLAFRDVSLQDIDLWENIAGPQPSGSYPVRQNLLIASGSVGRVLADRYFGTEVPYPCGEPVTPRVPAMVILP
jgi:2-polyprenyl-3-methyl-5-hydroxy-6-metoxy-1,4-benzoquinol methylase